MMTKVPPSRRNTMCEEDDGDDERDAVSEDDCAIRGDGDCDVLDGEAATKDDMIGLVVEEERNLEDDFGEAARVDDNDGTDADSGDDIWDDEKIPDSLSSSDEDEEEEETQHRDNEDPEELITLGKSYNSAKDFKISVLRYSLQTKYDIKLYRSDVKRVGAKCADIDVNCPWRVFCSYDKRKHKLQVKVYENEHICVRSGYSHMLKRSTIAWLFSERLRVNLKLTKQEMACEIKREYNLEVTEDQ